MPEDHPFDKAMQEATRREWEEARRTTSDIPPTLRVAIHAAIKNEKASEHATGEQKTPGEELRSTMAQWFLQWRMAWAAAVAVAVIACFFAFRSETIDLTRRASGDLSPAVSLPKTLRLDLNHHRMELVEEGDRLSGKLTPTNSPVGTIGFNFLLQGKDSTGIEAILRGTLWITNAPGRTGIKKSSDSTGALLLGFFEIPGRSTNAVEQNYGP